MKKPIKIRPSKKIQNNPVYKEIVNEDESSQKQYELSSDIEQNEAVLKEIFQGCSDAVFRSIKAFKDTKALIIYIEGLIDPKVLDDAVIKQLMQRTAPENTDKLTGMLKILEEYIVSAGQIKTVTTINEVVKNILSGSAAILVGGETSVLIAGVGDGEKRSIGEPVTEAVIRGPREGFTEDVRTNLSLLRRRLRTPKLKTENYTIGEITQTKVIIAYIKGIARDSIIQEVRDRLGRIKIDSVLESGYIEELIEDEPYTIFPLVKNTERPDVVAASLLEGKAAIFIDNTPFVLLVPLVFWGQIQANEDYYERFSMGTILRWIRLIYMFIALLGPSLYVAVTTFHQQLIPANLLISIVDAREITPFPAVVEALIMEVTFEALREAGLRLPKPVGQAVSIVGALVIGQSAVQAGIVSAPMVIVVAITGIAAFTIPHYDFSFAIRILRFPMILLAGTLGLYGVTLGVLGLLIHLVGLRSFGIPYFSPVAPLNFRGLLDTLVRAPKWGKHIRPELTADFNDIRVPPGQKPGPEQGKHGTDGYGKS